MIPNAEKWQASVVVVGAFAPRVYHPTWFSSYGLLGRQEVDASAREPSFLIHDQLANFKVGPFDIQVRPDRFQILTSREDQLEPMRDLFQGVLQVSERIPISALGFNWSGAFKAESEVAWHAAGDRMVHKDVWQALWPEQRVGMQNLRVRLPRADNRNGYVRVEVQPTDDLQYGVYVHINDHYDFSDMDEYYSGMAADFLKKEWGKSLDVAKRLMTGLYEGFMHG